MESQGSMILVTSNDTRGAKKVPDGESSKVTSEPILFNESPHLNKNA